jgi:hypothetical protein
MIDRRTISAGVLSRGSQFTDLGPEDWLKVWSQ